MGWEGAQRGQRQGQGQGQGHWQAKGVRWGWGCRPFAVEEQHELVQWSQKVIITLKPHGVCALEYHCGPLQHLVEGGAGVNELTGLHP